MTYQVRRGKEVLMKTTDERCRYSPRIEAAMQADGYDIYIDEKKLKKQKKGAQNG